MKSIITVFAVCFVAGCATPEFKGGATSDYRPAVGRVMWKESTNGATKAPCQVASIRKTQNAIHLEC